jgi:RluA family pseudouridine synthase
MRALRKGEVRLDGARIREGGAKLSTGAELYVPWEEPDSEPRVRRWGSVPVLWRGENVLVIDKPAGLLVQPNIKGGDSVVTRVWGSFGAGRQGFSPAAVHRLDRNTTGVLIVALTGEALRELERLFRERLVTKKYLAVVVGCPSKEGMVDAPLLKDSESGIVRVDKNGQTARTRYERLSFDEGIALSLTAVELLTGRTHQARVHLAHLGHPILGDGKYGNIEVNRHWKAEARRPLLHAFELGFPFDLTGALAEVSGRIFRSDMPEDMRRFTSLIAH